jgi:hypothetical protein
VVFNEISLLTGFYWLEFYEFKIRLNLETGMENENSENRRSSGLDPFVLERWDGRSDVLF